VVQVLIQNGADVNATCREQSTPLHVASRKGHVDVVQCLIQNQADSNSRDDEKRTPLHYASLNGHYDVVKVLVQNGADVNAKDKCLETPLHKSSKGVSVMHESKHQEYKNICNYLISNGCDMMAEDIDGKTAIDKAVDIKKREAILFDLLIRAENLQAQANTIKKTDHPSVTSHQDVKDNGKNGFWNWENMKMVANIITAVTVIITISVAASSGTL